MSGITLLHGSEQVVEKPKLSLGKPNNDYGQGFYCTELAEPAREWACKKGGDGFVNRYLLDTDGLRILHLSDGTHTVLNWIAILLKNRTLDLNPSSTAADATAYITEHFAIDTGTYDVIIGYRADDSYFKYAESFVQNTLPLRSLNQALVLGKLGLQTVLVSEKAFRQITFLEAEPVDGTVYYPRFSERDSVARQTYSEMIAKRKSYRDDIFVLDILREEMQNDDPRIQRILFE